MLPTQRLHRLVLLALVCLLPACEVPTSADAGPRTIYWSVELVGRDFGPTQVGAPPPSVPYRIFDDGTILAVHRTQGAKLRDPQTGVWTAIPFPTVAEQDAGAPLSQDMVITWYQDARNYGGLGSTPTPSQYGWARVDGVLHQCSTGACTPVALLDGGVLVVRTLDRYFGTWTPGENPASPGSIIDNTDIHTAGDFGLPCWQPTKVTSTGKVWLTKTCTLNVPPLRVQDFQTGREVDVGYEQFDDGATGGTNSGPGSCCAVNDMNANGDLLGRKEGYPVIKRGTEYERVAETRGFAFFLNKRGDVVFRDDYSSRPKMRLGGETFNFAADNSNEILSQLAGETGPQTVDNYLLERGLYLGEAGQLLFWARAGLYLATPSLERRVNCPGSGTFTFSPRDGTNAPARAPLLVKVATGRFSASQLDVSILRTFPNECGATTDEVRITAASGAKFVEGGLVPARTSVGPGGSVVTASTVFIDANNNNFLATGGGFRISSVSDAGFTATAEELVVENIAGTDAYDVRGEILVTP